MDFVPVPKGWKRVENWPAHVREPLFTRETAAGKQYIFFEGDALYSLGNQGYARTFITGALDLVVDRADAFSHVDMLRVSGMDVNDMTREMDTLLTQVFYALGVAHRLPEAADRGFAKLAMVEAWCRELRARLKEKLPEVSFSARAEATSQEVFVKMYQAFLSLSMDQHDNALDELDALDAVSLDLRIEINEALDLKELDAQKRS